MENLFGTIDVASITKAKNNSSAYGIFRGQKILVYEVAQHVGKECLIRLDKYRDEENMFTANFINSRIPPNFQAKTPEEYVLVGLWDKRMGGRPSSLADIDEYYNPGTLGYVFFLEDDHNKRKGMSIITPQGSFPRPNKGLRQMVANLPNPKRSCRMILMESVENLTKIINALEYKQLIPIPLQPIR